MQSGYGVYEKISDPIRLQNFHILHHWCLRHSMQWPRFAQNSMLYCSWLQWSDGFNASRIFLLMTSERRHRCLHREQAHLYTTHVWLFVHLLI